MWVPGAGFKGAGDALFGTVWVYPDERHYRPDNCHGHWNVTHWQPLPKPPIPHSHTLSPSGVAAKPDADHSSQAASGTNSQERP
ncbi:DUF551 domain-containing protein [Mesorhizobium sp. ESP-6-2]|uniref:DUF551 domain-containing protein n=1 Tax=Mesorhizobium sp. ESP-6-2 TaxID=2876625 RepID=UPI001CCA2272|nr:DUF551 domain-containing protein [Mesorhizobium sp. ESP-6-2]